MLSPPGAGESRDESVTTASVERDLLDQATVANTGRPLATQRAYSSKVREFKAFCAQQDFPDGDIVTGKKLRDFLEACVVNRPLKGRSHKVAPDTPVQDTRLSWTTVRTYVTAITDYWQQQRELGTNHHDTPRDAACRRYITGLRRMSADQERATYADEGQGTILDGNPELELRKIVDVLWQKTAEFPDKAEIYLRTLTDHLLSHYMLTRGENRREAQLSDFCTIDFPGEGPTRCTPLILTLRSGKTNRPGHVQTAGALRNRDPDICVQAAFAFYLLWRWDLSAAREAFPDFSSPRAWYDTCLLKADGKAPDSSIVYNTQLYWVSHAFELAGVVSSKKTHAGRMSEAKIAELRGVSESQIRRGGGWLSDATVASYLQSLPRKLMRSIAGHPPTMGGFELSRDVRPPDSLLGLIWPELDQWKSPLLHKQLDLAATGFVNLLFALREVILQDSVYFIDRYPQSPVWRHPVFRHADYSPWADQVRAAMAGGGLSLNRFAQTTHVDPELAQMLRILDARQRAHLNELQAQLAANNAQIVAKLAEIDDRRRAENAKLFAMLHDQHVADQEQRAQQFQTLLHLVSQMTAPQSRLLGNGTASAIAPVTLTMPSMPAVVSIAEQASTAAPQDVLPAHRMCREIYDVAGLWQEWMVGTAEQPSIAALDQRWGSRWRAGRPSEVQWYSLRLEVIKEIQRVARVRQITEVAAMQSVASEQQREGRLLLSLDAFCKHLRRQRKHREAAALTQGNTSDTQDLCGDS